jgi:hypothetical protein
MDDPIKMSRQLGIQDLFLMAFRYGAPDMTAFRIYYAEITTLDASHDSRPS